MKNHLLFALLCLTVVGVLAQEPGSFKSKIIRLDSTKKEKFPAEIHAGQLDSLWRIWQMEEAKRRVVAREQFLANFDKIPDSLPVLRMNRLDLSTGPDLSRFRQLKEIHADKNKLETIPESFFSSDSLRFVDLSDNPLKKLKVPKENSLVSLKMENCSLEKIPRQVRKMKNLKRLYLTRSAVRRLGKIKILQLAGNDIETLPPNINRLSAARRINFSKNKLSQLPSSFAGLDSLEVVIFYENNFSEIPPPVSGLKNLIELDFYYNNIDEIPQALTGLEKLERLYQSFNNIETLPDTLRSMKNLRRLYVHHNRLTVIPQWITGLDSLEILGVGYNQLVYFPDVSSMPNLCEVDIQRNTLEEIPWKLIRKKNLKLLLIGNNLFLEDENSLRDMKKIRDQRLPDCVIVLD